MKRYNLYLLIAAMVMTVFVYHAAAQPQSAAMGIFTATADWGLEPAFPPKIGEYKLPGSIEVSGSGTEAVYDVYGNGIDLGVRQSSDEAFYVYAARNGSFRISGKILILDPGGNSDFAQAGLMIRQDPNHAASPYFAIAHSNGSQEPYGYQMESKWRDHSDIEANYLHYLDRNGNEVGRNNGDGVFFRLTYIHPLKTVFSEWSYDEINWHCKHSIQMDLGENPVYGIFVNNDMDNEIAAHARVSHVKIEPLPAFAERRFSSSHFRSGDVVDVTVTVTNPTNTAQNITAQEIISEHTAVSDVSHNGQIDGATVTWSLTLMPGSHFIRYKLAPSPEENGFVPVRGWINTIPVIGDGLLTANGSQFTHYADWGTPVVLPENAKPSKGYAYINPASCDTVYDLYGSGDYWGLANKGNYLYTELQGSYRLSAKVSIVNSSDNAGGQAGLMLRGKGGQSRSKNYTVRLGFDSIRRSSRRSFTLENIQVNWQTGIGNNRPNRFGLNEAFIRGSISNLPDELYLRVTRIASADMMYSEWSTDGLTWHYIHQETFPLDESAAYGLVVNHPDLSAITHARFSDVKITPSPPIANRFFSRRTYQGGDIVIVVLEAFNPKPHPESLHIQESLPAGWTVTSISGDGKLDQNTILWDITAEPGITYLVYRIVAPSLSDQDVIFLGEINGETIIGNEDIKYSRLSIEQNRQYSLEQGVYIAVPVTLMLLHLLLYFFYPKMVENFYFALFAAAVSVVSYLAYQPSFTPMEGIDNTFRIILVIITVCIMLRFFYSLVYERLPLQLWILNTVPVLLVGGMFVWIYLARNYRITVFPYDWIVYGIATPGVTIVMTESIRILMILYTRKVDGYLILITGMIIMLVLIQYVLFWAMGADFGWWDIPIPSTLLETPVFFAPVFISMSVFLAYRFARTNSNLLILNADLEGRVVERTKLFEQANTELTYVNESLQEANARLQDLDKMKSSFVSQASHDLRTPLTAIKGSLDNLMLGIAGELSEKQRKILNRALTSVDRLSDLVTDVLDLNRIESGRVTLEKSNFNVCDAVKMMMAESRPAAAQKEITLSSSGLENPVLIHTDRSKLDRVISELIGNAIKYTPKGGKVDIGLRIDLSPDSEQKSFVSISVADTGIGLSEEDCTKIFERFYRVDAAINTAKGSGLGLSIAKELIALHEGTIEVTSEPGKGSIFTVKLPVSGYNKENA